MRVRVFSIDVYIHSFSVDIDEDTFAQEPYIFAKELYISVKEHYIPAKVPYISAKETYIYKYIHHLLIQTRIHISVDTYTCIYIPYS